MNSLSAVHLKEHRHSQTGYFDGRRRFPNSASCPSRGKKPNILLKLHRDSLFAHLRSPLSRGWAFCPPAADTSSFLQYFHPERENISLIAFMLGRRCRNSRLLPYGGGQISQNMKQAVVSLHVPRASTLRWGSSEKERLGARQRRHGRGATCVRAFSLRDLTP